MENTQYNLMSLCHHIFIDDRDIGTGFKNCRKYSKTTACGVLIPYFDGIAVFQTPTGFYRLDYPLLSNYSDEDLKKLGDGYWIYYNKPYALIGRLFGKPSKITEKEFTVLRSKYSVTQEDADKIEDMLFKSNLCYQYAHNLPFEWPKYAKFGLIDATNKYKQVPLQLFHDGEISAVYKASGGTYYYVNKNLYITYSMNSLDSCLCGKRCWPISRIEYNKLVNGSTDYQFPYL